MCAALTWYETVFILRVKIYLVCKHMNHCSFSYWCWESRGRSVRLALGPLCWSVCVTKWSKMSTSLRRSITASADILLTDRFLAGSNNSFPSHPPRRAERERKRARGRSGPITSRCDWTLYCQTIRTWSFIMRLPPHARIDKTRFSRLLLRFFTCHLGQHVNKLRRRCLDTGYTFTWTCIWTLSLILQKWALHFSQISFILFGQN